MRRALNIGAESTPPKVDRVPKIEDLEEADPRQGFFNDEDFYSILYEIPEHLKGLVEFAYWTGWRSGQIKKLEWSMVSIKERKISVPGSITKNKRPHKIHLNDPLLEVIRDRHSQTRLDCKYVFHLNGKQIKDFRGSWSSACRELGLGYGYSLTKKYVDKWKRRGLNPGRICTTLEGQLPVILSAPE